MIYYILTCRSLTYAQKINKLFSKSGVFSSVRKTPSGLSKQGCGYSVQIRREQLSKALDVIKNSPLDFERIFRQTAEGDWEEVSR